MKTCLVVDDSRVIRKVARKIVEDLGFACEEAADGQQALDFCQKTMPDAVLLDWNMPVMNGLDFLIKLRDEPDGKKPVVVKGIDYKTGKKRVLRIKSKALQKLVHAEAASNPKAAQVETWLKAMGKRWYWPF